MQKIKYLLPFVMLFILLSLLGRELFFAKSSQLPPAETGRLTPHFSLPNLFQPTNLVAPADFSGQVFLLNAWATWCEACKVEHSFLMKIKNTYHIPILGIDYKDDPQAAKQFLASAGNPYAAIGNDTDGAAVVDLGIYGTPETFVISKDGRVVFRQIGVINQEVWDSVLLPIILKYQNEN
jgi:cytochrome c biogenesis protein CcmG/thiol:disulfide interchange protein DsbE